MLILRLCYIVQRFLCSVRPDLIIPRVPKQSDGNHNIALQCQMLLGFHELIHKTGAAAQCGNLIFSYHYLSPKRSSVSASAFVCLSVHLNGASPHDSFLDAKESLSFNGNVNLNLMPYTLYLVLWCDLIQCLLCQHKNVVIRHGKQHPHVYIGIILEEVTISLDCLYSRLVLRMPKTPADIRGKASIYNHGC